jgi:hypothetical protein
MLPGATDFLGFSSEVKIFIKRNQDVKNVWISPGNFEVRALQL